MQTGESEFERDAAQAMQAVASRLQEVRPLSVARLELPALSAGQKQELTAQFASALSSSATAIYAIDLPDAAPSDVHAALPMARSNRIDDRCFSRVLPLPPSPTNTLYVGSSGSLHKRLMEHLGFGAKKTYSLHMLYWAQNLGRIVIDVRFYQPNVCNDLLCALEDHWAGQNVPLFGKRGSV